MRVIASRLRSHERGFIRRHLLHFHMKYIYVVAHRSAEAILRFKNERLPSVAVTVDLLTTGIDVPAVSNIVFLRRVTLDTVGVVPTPALPEARGTPVIPPSKILAMFGWSMIASAWRSASKRATTSRVSIPILMILSATRRLTGSRCSAI